MKLSTICKLWVFLCCLVPVASSHANFVFVHKAATGANDGSSWSDAYKELRDALSSAVAGDTLLVAAGHYTPTAAADPTASFVLVDGVALYGGFDGSEKELNQRDIVNNTTELSGNISGTNSHHVVFGGAGVTITARLDGFTIADGASPDVGGGVYLDSAYPALENLTFRKNSAVTNGGGLYANVNGTYRNMTFIQNSANQGGAMFTAGNGSFAVIGGTFTSNIATGDGGAVWAGGAIFGVANVDFMGNNAGGEGGAIFAFGTPLGINDCTFDNNTAALSGGGIYSFSTSSTFQRVLFVGNEAGSNGGGLFTRTNQFLAQSTFSNNVAATGGGLYAIESPVVRNCLFEDNQTTGNGGAAFLTKGARVTNSTFTTNVASTNAGAILLASTTTAIELYNCVSWSNGAQAIWGPGAGATTISTSLIEGSGGSGAWDTSYGSDGVGNLDTDPLFVNAAGEDFHLQSISPAVNSGMANGLTGTVDLDGNPRTALSTIDMGCYEIQSWPTDVAEQPTVAPMRLVSVQAAPNPFNPATTIHYAIPEAGTVTLRIFDIRGRLVRSLVDSAQHDAGEFSVPFHAADGATGVLLVQLQSARGSRSTKIMCLK